MIKDEVIRAYCEIALMAYHSIGNYPCDGFCDQCPSSRHSDTFRNSGEIIKYIRLAVVEKLKRDNYTIIENFDSNTGERKL